jgi:hypothetical protein
VTHHGTYRGVPLEGIRISSVQWSEDAADYIRTRSKRRSNDPDVEPEWATEAATFHGALVSWAPPPEGSGAIESESLLVLGYSDTAAAVLRVWLRPIDMQAGDWMGVNAAFVKANIARRFLERRKT